MPNLKKISPSAGILGDILEPYKFLELSEKVSKSP